MDIRRIQRESNGFFFLYESALKDDDISTLECWKRVNDKLTIQLEFVDNELMDEDIFHQFNDEEVVAHLTTVLDTIITAFQLGMPLLADDMISTQHANFYTVSHREYKIVPVAGEQALTVVYTLDINQ